ncbi:TPA: hypothetical protein RJR39_003582 [Burkholderia cenocepacia]|uniref:hypothetical protein n=1 Tax=Burkholderia cenocepacia TaxID=95486 RepID=UPI001B9DE8DF|nr:hypothetical protein [Burkholderia cenocepacia]MBR8196351.1 hypothetical protein [Burkholderia cenocepacia]HDV6327489.1 hypothetical protein [Burkholderia cenocepacia]HDV6351361.1 hypothetical protein [Burkholderia cenocepacia]
MKKVWHWIEVGFALCAIGVVTVFLVYAFKAHSEGAAAWIQAVGSIAAIGVAIWIGNEQNKKEMERTERVERKEALRSLTILTALLENLHATAKSTANAMEDQNVGDTPETRRILLVSVEQLRKSFYELPLQSMPDVRSARLLVNIRWYADNCAMHAEQRSKISESVGGAPGRGAVWRTKENTLRALLEELIEAKKAFE